MTEIRKTSDIRLNMKGKYVLGLDLGGTKIAVGLVGLEGKVLHSLRAPTPIDLGPIGVCKKMIEMSNESLAKTKIGRDKIIGIGLGAGGPLDLGEGMLLSPPNLPGFHRFPVRNEIEKNTGLKVLLENDANAAVLGEKLFGAGKKAKNLIYMTISTGIGGGLIVDGNLLHGVKWTAGEVGHMTLKPDGPKCNCGNYGCLEALSSGTGIAKKAMQAVRRNPSSLLLDLVKGDISRINAEVVFKSADKGDRIACEIVEEALFYLGIGIGNLITAFSPDMVILGGGLTKAGKALFDKIREIVRERVRLVPVDLIPIVPSKLGNNVGIVGAASLVIKEMVL